MNIITNFCLSFTGRKLYSSRIYPIQNIMAKTNLLQLAVRYSISNQKIISMRFIWILGLSFLFSTAFGQTEFKKSGNPIFEGWYADPEVAIYENKYWIYPTFSAPFEKQVFFDAFSS